MAQTPHQQIQVVQQQNPQMSAPQLQQVYFPQQQMLFPGNFTLQQTGSSPGQATLQSIMPNRSYSSMMPKAIQSSPVTVQSIGGAQRQLVPQMTNQTVGTYQPASFLSNGSFTTLGPLPVGYQWATSCYQQQQPQQQQSPIIIRSPHPGIYLQSPQGTIQIPMSAAQQMVTPTSFTTTPQIQLETQTIATQTLVPSVTAVNSNNSYIQLDPSTSTTTPSVAKSPPCNSPSSSTQDPPPSAVAPQPTPILPQPVAEVAVEEPPPAPVETPPRPLVELVVPNPPQPSEAPPVPEAPKPPAQDPNAAVPGTVSSTTCTAPAEVAVALPTEAIDVVVDQKSEGGVEAGELMEAEETDQPSETSKTTECFSPQKFKSAYLGPLKEKQPQKAIVKPQMVSQVKEESSKSDGQESLLENLKPVVSSPPKDASPSVEVPSLPVPNLLLIRSKTETSRKRGRPRRSHGRFRQTDPRRSSRVQQQSEGEGDVSKSSQASASQSSSTESMDAEALSPDPNASMVPMDIMNTDLVKVELKIDMPKTSPNTWTVDEVCDFIGSFPGCNDYIETFRSQEIDGQALLLIQLDHLMTGMAMKLGPAVKLIAHIRSMKEHVSS